MVSEYRRKKPMKIAERKDPLALISASCCGRCRFWRAPKVAEKDPFGECGKAVCIAMRVRGFEKGTLVTIDELDAAGLPQSIGEPMRTRSWAPSCPLFYPKQDIPAKRETSSQRALMEAQEVSVA